MQVFQRGVNESLVIGDDVVVTVLEISPACVRLAITDPHSVPQYREETLYLPGSARDEDSDSSPGEDGSIDTADSHYELAIP